MALIRWRDRETGPVDAFDWLRGRINELFEEFPGWTDTRGIFDREVSPPMDVIEDADRYVVECELPGMQKKDIDITLTSGVLTIKGEKKGQEEGRRGKVYRKEIWEGGFQRTLTLPASVDPDQVEAEYTKGVLRITLPKKEEAKARRIEPKVK